jgi:hypothetical protein
MTRSVLPHIAVTVLLMAWAVSACHGVTAPDSVSGTPAATVSAPERNSDCTGPAERSSTRSHMMGWGRDPFRHPPDEGFAAGNRAANGARLVAIIGGGKGRMAIFGHSILRQGDLVGNERILDIGENRVTVVHDGCKRIVAMEEVR